MTALLDAQRQMANALKLKRRANAEMAKKHRDVRLWLESCWFVRGNPNYPYSMKGFEFLEEPLHYQGREGSVMAGSGVGKTESFIPWALAHADWGEPMLYFFESEKKRNLIVMERVNPNFERNPYLVERNQGEADNTALKVLGDGLVYFLGLNEGTTSSYHGRKLVLDEFDKMDPTLAIDIIKRLTSTQEPIVRRLSNPSRPEFGIHKEFLEGDQRRWHVPCPHCKKHSALLWDTHVDQEKLLVLCPQCGKPMDRQGPGFWVPHNEGARKASWHMHRLMAPACDLETMREELNHEDERVKSAAFRMDLGLPFAETAGGLTDADFKRATQGNEWTEFAPGGFIACDPGGQFDVQLYKRPEADGTALCVWSGTVKGFAGLMALADSAGVEGGIIDANPESDGAKTFCKRQLEKGQSWHRVDYSLPEDPEVPSVIKSSKEAQFLNANRTRVMDEMVTAVRSRKLLFPKRLTVDPKSRFCQHMRAPRRVEEFDRHGVSTWRWVHEKTQPDHQFHCTTYANIYRERYKRRRGRADQSTSGAW